MNEVILFNHMSKSGGTSLRLALMKAYPVHKVLLTYPDYRLEHFPERAVLWKAAEEPLKKRKVGLLWRRDWAAYDRLYNNYLEVTPEIGLVYGHKIPYVDSITSRKVRAFTMMRHPYTRYVSLYNHKVHHGGEEKSFEDWIRNSYEVTSFMRECGLEESKEEFCKYERVFFFEHYADAVAELGKVFNVTLDVINVNPTPKAVTRSAETDRLIAEVVPHKIELYDFLYEKFR